MRYEIGYGRAPRMPTLAMDAHSLPKRLSIIATNGVIDHIDKRCFCRIKIWVPFLNTWHVEKLEYC